MTPFLGSGVLQAWKTPPRGLVLHPCSSSPWISLAGPRHPQPLEHRHVLSTAPHHPVRSEHVALLDRQHLHPVPLHLRSLRPHHRVRQPYRHLGGHLEEVPLTPFFHLVSSRKSLLHPHFNLSGTSTTLSPLFTGLAPCSSSAAPSSSPTFQSS